MMIEKRLQRRLGSALMVVFLCATGVLANACAYSGVAATPDGTVVITRNDLLLFGLLRKVYVCKVNGSQLACTETPAAP